MERHASKLKLNFAHLLLLRGAFHTLPLFSQKCFCLSCNARKEALCLASVTCMTRDINDTFVTNHSDDRKNPPLQVAGEMQY